MMERKSMGVGMCGFCTPLAMDHDDLVSHGHNDRDLAAQFAK